MRKPEQAPEPSIEEILASIRRIIADDAPAATPADLGGEQRAQPHIQAVPPRARPESGPRLAAEEEVLELTEDFMLAEEASAALMQEPQEPAEFGGSDPYASAGDEGSDAYRDPYDEQIAPRRSQQAAYSEDFEEPRQTVQEAAPEEEREELDATSANHNEALSAVMAEVQRFSQASKAKETPPPAPEPSADSWGQPDMEALMPQPATRPSSRPVWSARHKQNEPAKPADEAGPAHRAAAEPAAPAKPGLAIKENWGEGVQMPVPQDGPAIPFSAEDTMEEQPKPARPAAPVEQTPHEFRPADVAKTAQAAENLGAPAPASNAPNTPPSEQPAPSVVHTRAEALADKAVSDFASDKFSAPPVADILKADKPFMEAITSTLVDALSRGSQEPEDFDEAPNLEDFDEGSFAPGELAPPAPVGKAGPAMADIMNLDGGFMASRPVAVKQPEPAGLDQEPPELPREDLYDLPPAEPAPRAEVKPYRPIGIAEPAPMPNVPVAPPRVTPGPVAGAISQREPAVATAERLQPAGAGTKGLEDTVKELLKPLLMQWLDENMPRIVNEAIREEIAANGLLPRVRDGRR